MESERECENVDSGISSMSNNNTSGSQDSPESGPGSQLGQPLPEIKVIATEDSPKAQHYRTQGTKSVDSSQVARSTTTDTSPTARRPSGPKFIVTYFGQMDLEKRYAQQNYWKFILQWIIAEAKRRMRKTVLTLEVVGGFINGYCGSLDEVVFSHDCHQIFKFSRTQQDIRCFAYLTKNAKDLCYHCHIFRATEESVVSV